MMKATMALLAFGLIVTVGATGATARGIYHPGGNFWLTVLHNNDGESQLIDAGSGVEDFGGVARFATRLKIMRLQGRLGVGMAPGRRGVITVSSGDNFLAGPEFNASLEKGVPFYDSIALDLIQYDALCIGNHEFDFGPTVLADFIKGFRFSCAPFLSANLDVSAEPELALLAAQGKIAPSRVVRKRGRKIGMVGATTENLSFISSPREVEVRDVVSNVQNAVNLLTEQGVNIIVFISHLQSVNEDLELLKKLSGIDIAIAGGGDEMLANPDDLLVPGDVPVDSYPLWATGADGTEIPVVTTAGNYKYVGRLVAAFDRNGELLQIDEKLSGPVRVAGGDNPDAVPPAPLIDLFVTREVEAAVADLDANVLAVTDVALDGVRANVRTQETNQGNLIADALRWQATLLAPTFSVPEPDVAIQNGGGIRNDEVIAANANVTELDTFNILPFGNFLSVVPDIPREQFKELLENAVSRVEFTDGRFAQVAGFTFEWDPGGTPQALDSDGNVVQAGNRIRNVTVASATPPEVVVNGIVQPGTGITIATGDFLARGGDQYPYRGASFTNLGVTDQQTLANYLLDALDGVLSAIDYPEGGEGRITTVP